MRVFFEGIDERERRGSALVRWGEVEAVIVVGRRSVKSSLVLFVVIFVLGYKFVSRGLPFFLLFVFIFCSFCFARWFTQVCDHDLKDFINESIVTLKL